ncbi:PAS domain S-box protein [Natronolimnohabitans sp. A-GB9]|uniref:PAS domain S-box protein n=1 Tax=Natronolimnohabitans sp. A-GB9 TaxID=3069757 RepID=UPI0027B62CE1|nr:PAS domain S-box protein [Natronolimnohabitans sp. A-GB9]MDQ2049247.1 PAS domain S-box protein [Natronolimnohabitans sp. A-GB9]
MNGSSGEDNDGPSESDPSVSDDDPSDCRLDVRQFAGLVGDQAVSLLGPDGRIVSWHESAAALLGYTADEIVGRHFRQHFPPARREDGDPERLLERARTTGQAEDEGWRLQSDGSRLWIREMIVPVRETDIESNDGRNADIGSSDENGDGDGDGDDLVGYVCLLHDRTDEHERERELREEKALTESIFAAQPDLVYAFDTDGNYLKWNDRVPDVTGYTEAELSEMGPLEFIAPEHRDRVDDAIARILEDGERVAVEADLLTKDGRRIPHEFNSARISDGSGAVLGFTGVARDISDRKAQERELREEKALTESIFAAQPDLLYAYSADGNLVQWNDRFEQVTGYDAAELDGMRPLEFIAPPDRDRIADAIERLLLEGERVDAEARLVTADGQYVPYEFNSAPITDDDGSLLGFTGTGRDISDRKARERELERLERLNATIRRIDETMVTAESREEIETAVVDAFADADVYRFAAIGRVDSAATDEGDSWQPQAWAGIDADGVESVLPSYVDPPAGAGPSALETETVERYHDLQESEVDVWRVDARERDYGSVAVVPIIASGRTYGVFVVAAAESSAFTEQEREVLFEFGGTIGHAINAMVVRRLLYQDTVVELEFESTDPSGICIDLAEENDCRITLDHVLPLTDEMFVYYVTVVGADPSAVRSSFADHPSIGECRRIDAGGEESHWELVVAGPTITGLLSDYGARIRSQVVEDGVSTTVVQVSPEANVRELVDAVIEAYPETKLLSKRTVERPVETPGDFRRRVQEELTEKQRAALEAAYYGGYFEWPTRRSDASDIADRLGIARQTYHQHLRVAQEKLLTAYFEDRERERES